LTEEVQPESMPKITFIEHDGTERTVEADAGRSVMQAATDHLVPGILADCGGNCACATCHVYVDESWRARLTPPSKEEREMIDCALHVQENSRLSCQIPVTAELDGLVIRLPESQT
jgi:2Fe-2S ferredoxin